MIMWPRSTTYPDGNDLMSDDLDFGPHWGDEWGNDKPIDHPSIREQERTCIACPEQYRGTLQDGRVFYFRYRFGRARVSVGPNLNDAIWAGSPLRKGPEPEGCIVAYFDIGDDLQGIFDSCEQRDQVFSQLMQQIEGDDGPTS